MSHPNIHNHTRFSYSPLFLSDEDGYPCLVLVVKGTFTIQKNEAQLGFADKQDPVLIEGQFWGEPETSSYKFEPEFALEKPGTDIALIGHVFSEDEKATECEVGLRCGSQQQLARVVGNRTWIKKLGLIRPSDPEPLGRIPLNAEHAFGGWDRSHENPNKHRCEMRNPMGKGFHLSRSNFREGLLLPNIEEPGFPIKNFTQNANPVLFGFTLPGWEPRIKYAGTYNKKWEAQRKPLLPKDFDLRFFNSAPQNLIAKNGLIGNEAVSIVNAGRRAKTSFYLPGTTAPKAHGSLLRGQEFELQTKLDTVIIRADDDLVHLVWRARLRLRSGPEDLQALEITTEDSRLVA